MINIRKQTEDDLFNFKILSMLVKNLKTKQDFVNGMSAVGINSNIVDYLVTILINEIEKKIKTKLLESHLDVNINLTKIDTASLEKRVDILRRYEFPNKIELIQLLGEILHTRNIMFHSLIHSRDAFFTKIGDISKFNLNVDKFRLLVEQTLKKIWKDKNGIT